MGVIGWGGIRMDDFRMFIPVGAGRDPPLRGNIIDDDDSMKMIGHDAPGVDLHVGIPGWQPLPGFSYNFSKIVQNHFATADVAKQTQALVCHRGDEIRAGRA